MLGSVIFLFMMITYAEFHEILKNKNLSNENINFSHRSRNETKDGTQNQVQKHLLLELENDKKLYLFYFIIMRANFFND
jgi:hypothetical protein